MTHSSLLRAAACIALALIAGACTQNDGHIGALFGSWALTAMTDNGETVSLPSEATGSTVSFQNDIAVFRLLYGPDYSENSVSTWSQTDDTITFSFSHGNGDEEPGTGPYAPPSWLHFTGLTETVHVSHLTGCCLVCSRNGADGHIWTYTFARTW